MKIEVKVTMTDDTGSVVSDIACGFSMCTGIPGIDHDVEKEDFLEQARMLLSRVADTQLPAVYSAVEDEIQKRDEQDSGDEGSSDTEDDPEEQDTEDEEQDEENTKKGGRG